METSHRCTKQMCMVYSNVFRTLVTWVLVLLATTAMASAQDCACREPEYREFYCDDPTLTEVPDCVVEQATTVYVGNNHITVNGSTFSRFASVLNIGIYQLPLDYLPVDVFKGNPQLFDLFISDTRLQYISPEVFQYTPSLSYLSIYRSGFRVVTPDTFKYLPRLYYVTFQGNEMNSLFAEAFSSNAYIGTVILQDNPWVCDCTLMNLYESLISKSVYPGDIPSECANPPELRGRRVADLHVLLQCDGGAANKTKLSL